VARAAAQAAHDLGAVALVAFTRTGSTARELAARRESIPLLVGTPDPAVQRQLSAVWGVEAFVVPEAASTDEMVSFVDRALVEHGRAARGDLVVLVAGTPPGIPGGTNTMRVHRLGQAAR
jgi:pyruvate kinase